MRKSNRDGRWHSRVSARTIRSKGAVLLALVFAMLIALPSSAWAATVFMVGGLGQSTVDDYTMSLALGGKFTGSEWRRVNIKWPADAAPFWGTANLATSVAQGASTLADAIKDTDGPITVLGSSAGSLVVDEAMRLLVNDPDWDGGDVSFVVLADTTQKLAGTTGPIWNPFDTLSGYTYTKPPVTPYDLTVVNYEYDGWADFPDRWWNSYAVYNAIAGGFILHLQTWIAGPDLDLLNATKTVTLNAANGKTTTYLIHPETLPLVQLYPGLAPMQDWLKEQIDAGYSRNDQTAASNSLGLGETPSLATAPVAIEPDPQSLASTIDPSAGADGDVVEEQDQSQKRVVDATPALVDATPEPVDATPEPVKPTDGVAEAASPQAGAQLANADADGGILGREPTFGGPGSPGVTGVDDRDDTIGKETAGNKGAADAADGAGGAGGGSTPGGTDGA